MQEASFCTMTGTSKALERRLGEADREVAERDRLVRCQAARRRFEDWGITIADWAASHGHSRELVYAVLAGRIAAKRGRAHLIAVDLGIKPDPQSAQSEALAGHLDQSLSASRALAR